MVRASISPCSRRMRPRSSSVCSMRPTPPSEARRDHPAGADGSGLALLSPRHAAGAALRLSRPRAVRAGQRPSVQPEQARAGPLRQAHRPRPDLGRRPVRLQRRQGRPELRRARQRPVRPAGPGDRPGLHLGRRPPAAHALAQDADLRGPRQGDDRAAPRGPRASARHLPRAGRRAGHPPPGRSGRHGRRAAAGASSRRRPLPRREGPGQLLGLQHPGLLRPGRPLRGHRQLPRRRAAVQDDGPLAARGRHRGDPRRGLQPHRRGEPDRADALLARDRQRRLLHALAGGPPLLHGLHRLRQRAEHEPPARAPADHGQPAVLGHGDARRRLPVRPGQHAGPRAVRGQQARRLLRHHPPGPDPLAGQADRRALGRRPRRLHGRQLPGRLDRVERHLPRHDPRLLEGGREHRQRGRHPAGRLQRPLQGRRPAPVRQHQLHHLPRRLHRSTTSSATTRSTTRPTARTTATAATTTGAGTAASRGRPTTPRSTPCATSRSATSSPRCCSRRACR